MKQLLGWKPGLLTLAALPLLAVTPAASEPPKPRNAPKAIVINDDGFSAFYGGAYKTPDDVRKRILAYRDTQVAVLEWCFLSGSRVNYPSKVTDLIGDGVTEFPRRGDKLCHETLRRIADSGVNLTQVVADACHEARLLCYGSLRMNGDYPASWMGETLPRMLNSRFWWDHPEFRVRGPKGEDRTKLSYAFPEVRDFKLRILREVTERDIDGINLDFLRHPPFFGYDEPLVKAFKEKFGQDPRELKADDARWLQLRADVMTAFVRSVRAMLDDAGKRKSRHLGLSARVDWREYRAWGCDIERWLKERLLDYLVVAQHSLGGYEFDLAPFVKMAKGTGCAIYFGEEAITTGHDLTAQEDKLIAAGKMKPPPRGSLSLDQYRARAAKWYAAGADGVHLFNEGNLAVMRVLGSVEAANAPAQSPAPKSSSSGPWDPITAYYERQIEGWRVLVSQKLDCSEQRKLCDETLKLLGDHLYRISRVVPTDALAKLRRVPIWMELAHPKHKCMCYHPSPDWLRKHDMNPEKAGAVELANAKTFLAWTREQPWMVLHEMAHAYHHRIVGHDNAEIKECYKRAVASKKYDTVLYIHGNKRRHYALDNDQEYFAECTEAFFGTNDFYPFVCAELKEHDPAMFELLKKLWGVK